MVSPVFVHHVVGDLTVGKPDLVEFDESETVESAVHAIANCSEGSITVWRKNKSPAIAERFVGLLSSVELVAFIAAASGGGDHQRAMKTRVADVVVANPSLLREVEPDTRLIEALEMMKQGLRRLLVRKSAVWKGVSKRFSVFYSGKWLKNLDSNADNSDNTKRPSTPVSHGGNRYCCLSREDVLRFLIDCLGALNPIPLSSISSLGAITPHYSHIEASMYALEGLGKLPQDPCAVAVVETNSDGTHKIIGEISAYKLWKCDYVDAAWAVANLTAGQFVMGAEDNEASGGSFPSFTFSPPIEETRVGASSRPKKFSSRSIGFFSASPVSLGGPRGMYRGRSAPLTCKQNSSLAAVMAQILSHRATHVWVTEAEAEDDILIGIVSYNDIFHAVTKYPGSLGSMVR